LLRPHDMDFLLQRRVIEILDARRLLLTPSPATPSQPLVSAPSAPASAPAPGISSGGPPQSVHYVDLSESASESRGAPSGWSGAARAAPQATDTSGQAVQQAKQAETLERMARAEAWLLARRLRAAGRPSTDPFLAPALGLFQPATYEDSVYYLQWVAAACRPYGRRGARARAPRLARSRGSSGEKGHVGETHDA
jgi:hypothetical protein